MNKKQIIIIPNEQEVRLPIFTKKCNYHREGIINFVFNNGINLYGKEYSQSFPEMSFELAEQNYLVIGTDEWSNEKVLIAFLPNKVSPRQLEYFERGKERLKEYEIMFYSYDENNNLKIYDNTTISAYNVGNNEISILDELIKELNRKSQTSNKIKKLVKEPKED